MCPLNRREATRLSCGTLRGREARIRSCVSQHWCLQVRSLEADCGALQSDLGTQRAVLESKAAAAVALVARLATAEAETHSLGQQVRLGTQCVVV